MTEPLVSAGRPALARLADALSGADRRLDAVTALLEGLVALGPCRLLDEQTVARAGALIDDLAAQLAALTPTPVPDLPALLAAQRALLVHVHALSIEWKLAQRLATTRGLDPVLPPLLARRLDAVRADAGHAEAAALARATLAALVDQHEAMRAMRLPLRELPPDLRALALATLDNALALAGLAAAPLAGDTDTPARLALLRHLLDSLGADLPLALQIDEAGPALFLTALATATGVPRDTVALATAEADGLRLALLLRAAGLDAGAAAAQLLALMPGADPVLVSGVASAEAAEALLGLPTEAAS